jgi:hypothetical protein
VPGTPACYAVLGYGGNGITFGASQIIAAQLYGTRGFLALSLDACGTKLFRPGFN